jgi:hypothetical protein
MRGLFQLLSVPASVIALIAVLGIAGGVEQGTISLCNGACAFAVIAIIGYIVYLAFRGDREEEDDGQDTAE